MYIVIWELPLSPESFLESRTSMWTKHKSSSSEVYVLSYNFDIFTLTRDIFLKQGVLNILKVVF